MFILIIKIGFTRITRALFIAKQCEPLAVEAYKFAIAEIKSTTLNTSKYMATVDALNTVLRRQGKAVFPPDQDWVMNTTQSNKTILDNLENDLKSAKVNVFKEEIRASVLFIRLFAIEAY
jgi:COP9 signalosome complex subunit 1